LEGGYEEEIVVQILSDEEDEALRVQKSFELATWVHWIIDAPGCPEHPLGERQRGLKTRTGAELGDDQAVGEHPTEVQKGIFLTNAGPKGRPAFQRAGRPLPK